MDLLLQGMGGGVESVQASRIGIARNRDGMGLAVQQPVATGHETAEGISCGRIQVKHLLVFVGGQVDRADRAPPLTLKEAEPCVPAFQCGQVELVAHLEHGAIDLVPFERLGCRPQVEAVAGRVHPAGRAQHAQWPLAGAPMQVACGRLGQGAHKIGSDGIAVAISPKGQRGDGREHIRGQVEAEYDSRSHVGLRRIDQHPGFPFHQAAERTLPLPREVLSAQGGHGPGTVDHRVQGDDAGMIGHVVLLRHVIDQPIGGLHESAAKAGHSHPGLEGVELQDDLRVHGIGIHPDDAAHGQGVPRWVGNAEVRMDRIGHPSPVLHLGVGSVKRQHGGQQNGHEADGVQWAHGSWDWSDGEPQRTGAVCPRARVREC